MAKKYTQLPPATSVSVDDIISLVDGTTSSRTTLGVVLDLFKGTLNSEYVRKTLDETVGGVKTFSSSPIVPTPTGDFEPATKKYVDDNGGIGDMLKNENLSGLTNTVTARANIGLGNVNNTSDADKPLSTATSGALSGKSNVGHTHSTGEVTGLTELIEDTIGSKVIGGTNVTVSYNDTTGETTISSSGGSGGGDLSSNTSTSVDNEVMLFSGTAGKTAKRGTALNGLLKLVNGIFTAITGSDLPLATTSSPGAIPTLPNDANVFLNGLGGFSTPPGGSGGISWTNVTGTTQAMAVNNGYISNNASLVTLTLPTTATIGSIILIQGAGAGGWKLAQNAGQSIMFKTGSVASQDLTTTGTGGYIESTDRYDSIEVMCIIANTGWVVRNSKGNPNLN